MSTSTTISMAAFKLSTLKKYRWYDYKHCSSTSGKNPYYINLNNEYIELPSSLESFCYEADGKGYFKIGSVKKFNKTSVNTSYVTGSDI
jgi:hypothetical protein